MGTSFLTYLEQRHGAGRAFAGLGDAAPERHTWAQIKAMDDDELVALAKTGTPAEQGLALRRIYDRYLPVVKRKLDKISDRRAIEEITNDVFMALAQVLPKFKGKASLKTLIIGIAVRRSQDYGRSRARADVAADRTKRLSTWDEENKRQKQQDRRKEKAQEKAQAESRSPTWRPPAAQLDAMEFVNYDGAGTDDDGEEIDVSVVDAINVQSVYGGARLARRAVDVYDDIEIQRLRLRGKGKDLPLPKSIEESVDWQWIWQLVTDPGTWAKNLLMSDAEVRASNLEVLTTRQRQVLTLYLKGMKGADAAAMLGIDAGEYSRSLGSAESVIYRRIMFTVPEILESLPREYRMHLKWANALTLIGQIADEMVARHTVGDISAEQMARARAATKVVVRKRGEARPVRATPAMTAKEREDAQRARKMAVEVGEAAFAKFEDYIAMLRREATRAGRNDGRTIEQRRHAAAQDAARRPHRIFDLETGNVFAPVSRKLIVRTEREAARQHAAATKTAEAHRRAGARIDEAARRRRVDEAKKTFTLDGLFGPRSRRR